MVSLELQKQHLVHPVQFLLTRLSFVRMTHFLKYCKNTFILSGIFNFHDTHLAGTFSNIIMSEYINFTMTTTFLFRFQKKLSFDSPSSTFITFSTKSSHNLNLSPTTTGDRVFAVCQSTRKRPICTRQSLYRVPHTAKPTRQPGIGKAGLCRVLYIGHTAKPLPCAKLGPRQKKGPSRKGLCTQQIMVSLPCVMVKAHDKGPRFNFFVLLITYMVPPSISYISQRAFHVSE